MRWWKYCPCILALILVTPAAFAADPAPEEKGTVTPGVQGDGKPAVKGDTHAPGDEGSVDSRKLLEEVLMARLTRELSLNEEQSVLMVRHLAEFREKMADIRRERMALARNLRLALRDNKDDETVGKLLEEVVACEEKATAERRKFVNFEEFKLSTSQKARLYLFIVDFEGDMRRLLKQAQERRLGHGMKPGRDNPSEAESDASGASAADGDSPNTGVDASPAAQ